MKVLIGLIVVAMFAQYRGGPGLSHAHPLSVLAIPAAYGAIAALAWGSPLVRRVVALLAGGCAAAAFFAAPALAWSSVLLAVAAHACSCVLRKERPTNLVLFLAAALVGAVASRSLGAVLELPLFGVVFLGMKGLVIALFVEGCKEREETSAPLGYLVLAVTLGLVLYRVVDVVGSLSGPVEVSWAEAPFLVDMLKLDAHEPIYGPLADVNSYTYSPLLELLHHAILAPFHQELSLVVNRALTLVDLFVACVVFCWALAPHVKDGLAKLLPTRAALWGFALALLVGFSNMLVGSIHPDHPSLVCIAVALALVVHEEAFPRWLYWTALVLVTPVSVAFKLTGAGVGIGLFAVMLAERRLRECGALALSGLLSVATIPLFDATCGQFSKYAIAMQRSHSMELERLFWPPTIHFAAMTTLALVATALMRSSKDALLRRIMLLFAGISVLMLPAYLKFAGRENNLLALLVGGVILIVVAAAQHAMTPRPRMHPLLGPALALYVTMLVWTPHGSTAAGAPIPLTEQMLAVDAAMTEDDKLGERSLVPSAALWIRHGRRDVPVDRTNSAYELSYGHHPEAELFFQHIEDGRYRTVVAWSGDLERAHAPAFVDRYTRALASRYDRIYPPAGASAIYLIYRRR